MNREEKVKCSLGFLYNFAVIVIRILHTGAFNGGEGVQRELLFRKPVILSVLTERRVLKPYGMNGGEPGKRGLNLLIKTDGRIVNLGGKTAVPCDAGDMFSMKTPGGGGYGLKTDAKILSNSENADKVKIANLKGSVYQYTQAQESA